MAKAKELALKICKNAPLSNFAITNSLPRMQDMCYDDGLYFERMVAEYTRSPEFDHSGCTSSSTRPRRACGWRTKRTARRVTEHSTGVNHGFA